MCWAEKCCYFIPLNLACVILGIINFIVSTSLVVISLVYYFMETDISEMNKRPHLVAQHLGLDLKLETVNIILSVTIVISLFWMIFSAALLVGILRRQPSLLLTYFSFGIILTILGQLTGLLLLLNSCWFLASVIFILSTISIHFLVVVHTAYDLMLKGNDFSFNRLHDQREDPLSDCFDETLETN